MKVKDFAATMGLGILTGAAVMMMIPRSSKVYQAAYDAATTVKRGISDAVDALS